jgi:hypothetical protein
MKRIFAVALIGAFVAGIAFADIDLGKGVTLGGHAYARLVPFASANDETVAGNYWGRLGLVTNWQDESGKAGLRVELQAGGGGTYGPGFATIDNAKAWFKPFDMLKVTYGKFVEDDFRGKFAASDDDIAGAGDAFGGALNSGYNADWVFSRFQVSSGTGLHLALTPIEALKIEAAVDIANGLKNGGDISDLYGTIQVGLGYTIANVGLVRFQFISGNTDNANPLDKSGSKSGHSLSGFGPSDELATTQAHRIEGAFNVTAVPNLGLDIGFKIPLAYESDVSFGGDEKASQQQDYVVALSGNYKLSDPFILNFQVITSFGGKLTYDGDTYYENPFGFFLCVQPVYTLNADLNVGAHLAMKMTGKYKVWDGSSEAKEVDDTDTLTITVLPWVQKKFGVGSMKLGLGLNVPAGGAQDGQDISFFIPLTFAVSF